jgi:hypothetical protein
LQPSFHIATLSSTSPVSNAEYVSLSSPL